MEKEVYIRPYRITKRIEELINNITELVGQITNNNKINVSEQVKYENQVKNVHATLTIENINLRTKRTDCTRETYYKECFKSIKDVLKNEKEWLKLEDVRNILEGRDVLDSKKAEAGIRNVFNIYNMMDFIDETSVKYMCWIYMNLLEEDEYKSIYRKDSLIVFSGNGKRFEAPFDKYIHEMMERLMSIIKDNGISALIKACLVNYYMEVIYPFNRKNGQIGRFWQTLVLYKWNPIFEYVPIDAMINENIEDYYMAMSKSDEQQDSTSFIEYMLYIIYCALMRYIGMEEIIDKTSEQQNVEYIMNIIGNEARGVKEILEITGIKRRETLMKKYIRPAVKNGLIKMTVPDKPKSCKQKYVRS